ncbi:hypothetical protein AADG42_06560 [Ammonicoccus fulvus]|uniref:Helix-turn-helix domain-containing protein n=1 Tax=Ammonicoccus fulvus TaxID=3138240 RepID=A0ABZ3FMR3_9ACTN
MRQEKSRSGWATEAARNVSGGTCPPYQRTPSNRPTVADWKALVYRHKGIHNTTRVMLLYLADRMGTNLIVSVPRSRIAADLGIGERRVTERMKAAVEVQLLDPVAKGRPGVTAVYAAMFPDMVHPSAPYVRDVPHTDSSAENPGHGAPVRTINEPQHGAGERTIKPPLHGADGGPANSKQVEPEPDRFQSPRGDVKQAQQRESLAVADSVFRLPVAAGEPDPVETGVVMPTMPRPLVEKNKSEENRVTTRQRGGETVTTRQRGGETVLDEIQRCAADGWVSEDLADLLNELEPGMGDWAINYWSLPRGAATNRYSAGRQLIMLTNTWRKEGA